MGRARARATGLAQSETPAAEAATDEDLDEADFDTWTDRQGEHLCAGRLSEADIDDIAEGIESFEPSQAAALRLACRLIAMQLLKVIVQRGRASRSWRTTVTRERLIVEQDLADAPGLKPRRGELFDTACHEARREADTGVVLGRVSITPSFTVEDVASPGLWSAPAS